MLSAVAYIDMVQRLLGRGVIGYRGKLYIKYSSRYALDKHYYFQLLVLIKSNGEFIVELEQMI